MHFSDHKPTQPQQVKFHTFHSCCPPPHMQKMSLLLPEVEFQLTSSLAFGKSSPSLLTLQQQSPSVPKGLLCICVEGRVWVVLEFRSGVSWDSYSSSRRENPSLSQKKATAVISGMCLGVNVGVWPEHSEEQVKEKYQLALTLVLQAGTC